MYEPRIVCKLGHKLTRKNIYKSKNPRWRRCKLCARISTAHYYREHRKKTLRAKAVYYLTHRAECLKYTRRWFKANPAKYRRYLLAAKIRRKQAKRK